MTIQLRSSVQQLSIPDPPGLLDLYPSDTAAGFSYRRLKRSATLCCRVKRLTDNVEMDFGFVYNAELDEFIVDIASILSFLGGATGSISRWYDQNYDAFLRYFNYSSSPGIEASHGYLDPSDVPGVGTKRLIMDGVVQKTVTNRVGHFTSEAIGNSSWIVGPSRISDNRGYIAAFCVAQPTYASGKNYTLLRMHQAAPTTYRSGFHSRFYHSSAENVWGAIHESHRTNTTNATGSQIYQSPAPPRGSYPVVQSNTWTDYNATLVENAGVPKRGIQFCGGSESVNNFHTAAGNAMHLGFQPGGYGWDTAPFHGIYNECIIYNTNEQHANRVAISLNQMAYYGITPYVVP